MVDSRPIFDQVNLVVSDMPTMVEFYERLGLEIGPTLTPWDRHHRNISAADGIHFDLDSLAFVPQWNQGWPSGETGPVLGFRVASAEAVDATYADLISAGYGGQQPPHDALMGARYAVVVDPDGNSVGLMGPRDPARLRQTQVPED